MYYKNFRKHVSKDKIHITNISLTKIIIDNTMVLTSIFLLIPNVDHFYRSIHKRSQQLILIGENITFSYLIQSFFLGEKKVYPFETIKCCLPNNFGSLHF